MAARDEERLLVQIASYNTNLQGNSGLPQDLVDWLSPTLQVSSFLSPQPRAPDIVAVGFQELLPLHLGLSGHSKSIIDSRAVHILSQIEAHAPNKGRYSLIAKVVRVGVALLIYALDDGVARNVTEVQTQHIGCGPMYMGNKGAVGVRFRVDEEVFTFVCAHLTAHEHLVESRIRDYHHIARTLLFPNPTSPSQDPANIFETSHLFFFGDLNFRISVPPSDPLFEVHRSPHVEEYLSNNEILEKLKEYDQLTVEHRKGSVFVGLKEGEFWKFKCSFKYQLGEVDRYSTKRLPSWTDRILYATYTDSPDDPNKSEITNLLYTSIPSYTTSDHKPIVALLLLPPPPESASSRRLCLPPNYTPTRSQYATLQRCIGRTLDRIIGYTWWFLQVLGAGNAVLGIFNFFLGLNAWRWYVRNSVPPNV